MCGIAGAVYPANHSGTLDMDILKKMSDVIVHRGPDDEGHYLSPDRRCGLVFRRLAIIDLSMAGHQPMTTDDGRFTIVFNGEIYNHASIRQELEARGYRYRSKTDTETILYGYREWGEAIVSKLVGMWGLAIWDAEKQELFCARDRIGIKPFYYYLKNGLFVFGSEIKSILEHPDVAKGVNYVEVANYLCYSMSGTSATCFDGVEKLEPGTSMIVANGQTTKTRFWSCLPPNKPMSRLSAPEIQTEIMRLLRQAVKDRMMSDVPFGAFLSGGIDSSTNVALMAELMNRPVDTFSVGFKELEKYNEMEYARSVAKLFGTNHHEIMIDHNDALPVMEDLVWHEDEPNGDPVCIPLYFLSKLTRQAGTTVIQVGEGSDEQFVGYSWMSRELKFYRSYWKAYKRLPKFVRLAIYAAVKPLMLARGQWIALDYIRRASHDENLYWGGAVDFTTIHMEQVLGRNYKYLIGGLGALANSAHAQATERTSASDDYAQKIAYYELHHRLPELLLMRVDKMTMAHSLEARVPFLDHRLVEFTMTIPEHLKLPAYDQTKILLKKAVEGLIPHEIIYRRKQGFAAPMTEWLRTHWYGYCESTILSSAFVRDGFLDRAAVTQMLERHRSGKQNYGKSLYSLLNLALWHKRFF